MSDDGDERFPVPPRRGLAFWGVICAALDFCSHNAHLCFANVAFDGFEGLRVDIPFSYCATSSTGAFAGGYSCFLERKRSCQLAP